MADKIPDFETIERVIKTEPQKLLDALPDSTEARSAKRHLDLAYDYAHQARERSKPE
jgi:hypothetical protein